MKILAGVIFIFLCLPVHAQILKKIKDNAVQKAKASTVDKAKHEARAKFRSEVEGIRAEFDSSDFDYAILVSDNSGLFNVRDNREFGGKFLTIRNIGTSLRRGDIDLTDEENAKLNLHMGQSAFAMGRYDYAEKRFNTAAAYFEKGGLTYDPLYLKTISNKGLLYATVGRYTQAEEYTAEALKLRSGKFDKNDMGIATSLNNYAVLHYNLGQYNESEKKFAQALSIIQVNKLDRDIPAAIVLNNQAILYQAMGRYDAAEDNMKKVLAIGQELGKRVKPGNLLRYFSNLALLYQQMGKYSEAESIYQNMEKRIVDRSKPEYANLLNNLAILYMVMNKQDRIEAMLKQAASIFAAVFTENSPAYSKVINDLGNFFRYKERYAEALPLLEKSLQVREQALGSNHPLYIQTKEDLAILHWRANAPDKASVLYRDVMERSLDFVNRYFPPMSEAEKTRYWDLLSPRFQRFYNFAVARAGADPKILEELFTYRMATKGLLLNSTRKITESIVNGGNEKLSTDYLRWLDMKEELARLYVFSRAELQEQQVNLDSLERAANALEKQLSENSAEFSRYFFTSKTGPGEILKQLKNDEALVEIIRVRNFDQVFTDRSKYIALVVVKDSKFPQLVIWENGSEMENTVFKIYRKAMKNKVTDEQAYGHYWSALETALKNKKKVYVSLDGVYNEINLNTLKKPGGDFLINQLDIVLLGNPRDLLTTNDRASTGKSATLIGNPQFASTRIPQLPATKTEVDGINKVLKPSGYQVTAWVQQDATESNLKSARRVSLLHIATHGYFLKDVEKASWPIGVHSDNAREHVLLRSGLMLTGASESGTESPDLQNTSNGVITSFEAMNLDLNGTDLVVLSACETGLGEIKAGEGVYGLQRAFLVAGAEALIMSLWKVDDAATQQLMNQFYANWVKTGDRQQAFRQAQQQLMTKFKEPYYWGAFVMMGK